VKTTNAWEQILPPDILRVARGLAPEISVDRWRQAPRFGLEQNDSSCNHPAMALPVGLARPETYADALGSLLVYEKATQKFGFELWEPGSRKYGHMTLGGMLLSSRLLAKRPGDREVQARAFLRKWLEQWWGRERACMVDVKGEGPRSLRCGARSQGDVGRLLSDFALSLTGLSEEPWQFIAKRDAFWGDARKPSLENTWVQIYRALEHEIVTSAAGGRLVSYFPSLVETHVLRTTGSLAAWCQSSEPGADALPNNNTIGIAAMGVNEGEFWALPVNGYPQRVRSKQFVESCWRENWQLRFRLSIDGELVEDGRHDLPPGDVVSEIVYTREGTVLELHGASLTGDATGEGGSAAGGTGATATPPPVASPVRDAPCSSSTVPSRV
jgi:hypothetical protein